MNARRVLFLFAAVLAGPFAAFLLIPFTANAQVLSHTPLKGIAVRLQSIIDTTRHAGHNADSIEVDATTDEDGAFMFGYVPPGTYALGCSYSACFTAYHRTKHTRATDQPVVDARLSPDDPLIRLSVNACEGMVCHVAVGKMMPDDWAWNAAPSANAQITKEWTNTTGWLKAGGGVRIRINGANTTVSGKIEAQ